ncbi:DUF3299 domain-containing protein [Ruegeria sp. WL0004]|uniref:DUF3299 domain-containing protein n=1 Tax=Ruegeria marisflavi TaxID=2984152 RepID=A0ABT2WW11_9RHOB|nr:DUF3299 domain-containing protein [Ruegeria sp. WL0004]MCU9840094.1 DUF3299 domain-containing protein [Ruegeria sp. WL0004]
MAWWIALSCVWASLVLPDSAFAEPVELARWGALAPATEPYDDPFLEMSYQQKNDLRTILDAAGKVGDAELEQRSQEARARLRDDGYDADQLLAQRLVVMEKRREEATGVTGRFLGREVLVDGYVLPLHAADGRVHSFLLVPWVGACIHTPPPPPNQMIRVDVPDGLEIDKTFHAIRLRGVLEHQPTVSNLFLVDGQRVVEASYTLTNAQAWGEPGEIPVAAEAPVDGNLFARAQIWINNLFTSAMRSIEDGRSLGAAGFALMVAFLYGALHTLGPGHGKAVVVSYFIGEGGSLRRGILMGSRIAVFHVVSAVAVVFLLDLAVRQTTGAAPSDYRLIRLGSYGLIVLIGATLVWQAAKALVHQRRHHAHGLDTHTGCAACSAASASANRSGAWIALAVGAVPCTGALIVMLFGLANDLVVPAILMVIAISAGMAVAMSMIGMAAIWGRAALERRAGTNPTRKARFEAGVRLVGASFVLLLGLALFLTTWSQPVGTGPAAARVALAETRISGDM